MKFGFALTFSFVFLFIRAEAQDARAEYFITLKGDTVQADILKAPDSKNTFGFKYKSTEAEGQYQEYKPGDVKEVIYGNEKYVSAFLADTAFNQVVFLKLLIEGQVRLYKAVDPNGAVHFLFKEADEEPRLMRKETYSGLLKIYLPDCATINFDDPTFLKRYGYSTTGLSKFFRAYNTCVNSTAPVLEHKNKPEIYFTKGVTAGVASSSVSLNLLVAKPGNYGTYSGIIGGIFGELHFGRHLSTLLAAQYHNYEGQMLAPDAFYKDEIYIGMQFVRVPLLIKYSTSGKVNFFANVGPHGDMLVGQHGRRNYSNIVFDYNPDIAKLSYGMTGGAGVALSPFPNKTKLEIEARYSNTSLYTGVNVCGNLTSYQLLASFSF